MMWVFEFLPGASKVQMFYFKNLKSLLIFAIFRYLGNQEINIFSNELGNYQPFYKILGTQLDGFVSFSCANPNFTLNISFHF